MIEISRKVNEALLLGSDIRVTVLEIQESRVRVQVSAQRELDRKEYWLQKSSAEDPRNAGL